jgi:uncharacterized protein
MSFEEAKEFVRKKFEDEKRDASHDFPHVERVLKYAEFIGKRKKVDMEVLRFAALFHDYAHEKPKEPKRDHGKDAVEITRKILPRYVPKDKIRKVQHAIAAHSRRSEERPETLEAKIIWDADKLDACGPTGAVRYLIRGEHRGWTIEHSSGKALEKLEGYSKQPDFFYTDIAKKIAKKKFKKSIRMCKEILDDIKHEPDSIKMM